jgi:hypothetical protein
MLATMLPMPLEIVEGLGSDRISFDCSHPHPPGCQPACKANLDFVLGSFLTWTMWTRTQDLRLSVVMGLRKGLRLVRGMRRSLTEDEQHKVADAIVEHLEQSNWKIEQGQPGEGHGQYLMK